MEPFEKSHTDQLEERINFRLEVERTIGDISTYLVFSSNFKKAIEYYLSEITDLYHKYVVDGAVMFLFDEPVNEEILVLTWGDEKAKPHFMNFERFPIEELNWLQAETREGHEVILNDEFKFPEEAKAEQAFIKNIAIKTLISIPIFTPEYIAGGLILVNITQAHKWESDDILTLRLFADILGTAIFRKKTEERLSKSRDYLKQQVKRKTQDLATEKKRIELILNTIKDGIIVLDEDGKVTMVNDIAKRYYRRILNEELVLGTNLLLSGGHPFYETIGTLFRSHSSQEISIEPLKGLHLQFVSAKEQDPGLAPSGTIIEFRDITPFIEFDNIRKQFVSTVSHELRTPITVINQSINNYEKYGDKLPETTKTRLISAISRNARLLHELVEDLLLISRIDERRIKFHWEEYDVQQVLNEVIIQLEPRAQAKEIGVSTSINIDHSLFGDPKRIAQIFRIILDNSLKYSNSGDMIQIEGIDSYEGEYNKSGIEGILLKFSDTGIGISEEDLPKLFERFYRSKRVSHVSGTGLGLSIAYDLVKLHKGEIFIESTLGEGTTVFLFLPRLNEEILDEDRIKIE